MAIIFKFPDVKTKKYQDKAQPVKSAAPSPARRKRGATKQKDQRQAMLAKIHIALPELYKKLAGFTEDVYRYTLSERFGKNSAADLTNPQLHQVLVWLSGLGFTAKKGRHKSDAPAILEYDVTSLDRQPRMTKIEAMLAEKGRVEQTDVPWAYAVGILKRQTRNMVKCFDHASPEQLDDVIAALYKDARRKGRKVY